MSAEQIRIDGVTKVYPGATVAAVDAVSLGVAEGEFMTFLGPSGSGKTTMLSMISGMTELTEGRILLDGKDISGVKPYRRNLGVVFQQYALFPHMSVAKNIAFPLEQRGMGKAEIARRVAEVLELVHLEDYAKRLPKQLSGGEQQRVALARAVVYEPRALLMDEPLGALDKRLRDQLRREIARMHRELGMTFIFVTHDQEEALTLSDRIAVFNKGVVEQVGSPADLYDRPETLFVAEFLGESNCFRDTRGTVTVVRPERMTVHGDGQPVPSGHNRLDCLVTDIVYVGNHHRIGVRYPDGSQGSVMRLVGGTLPAVPGERVVVSWDPSHEAVVSDPLSDNGNGTEEAAWADRPAAGSPAGR
jgi:putative spermidine/putrescine transport system ATP-binding protein